MARSGERLGSLEMLLAEPRVAATQVFHHRRVPGQPPVMRPFPGEETQSRVGLKPVSQTPPPVFSLHLEEPPQ